MSTLTLTPEISQKQRIEKQPLSQTIFDILGVASGLGFMFLFSYGSNLVSGPPTETNKLMADFYAANKEAIFQVVYFRSMGMMSFLIFACTLAALIRRKSKEYGIISNLVMASGSLAAITMVIGQAMEAAAARITDTPAINPDIIRALDEISHIVVHLFAAPLGIFLIAATVGVFISRLVPRILCILSAVPGITLLITCGTFNSQHTLHGVGIMALMGFLLWTLIICVALLIKILWKQFARTSYAAH